MELLQIVLRVHPPAVRERIALDPHRNAVSGQRGWCIEGHLQGVVVYFGECRNGVAPGLGLVRRKLLEVGDGDFIVPPEHHVIDREWVAVRPLHTLAEIQGPFRRVRVGFPLLGEAGANVESVTNPSQWRVSVHEIGNASGVLKVIGVASGKVQRSAVLASR